MIETVAGRNLQGAARFVSDVEDAVEQFLCDPKALARIGFPTVSTQNGSFPPVLLAARLSNVTGHSPSSDELPAKLVRAYQVLGVLDDIRSGNIIFTKNTLQYLSRRLGAPISWKNSSVLFDLFYGALQLLAYAELTQLDSAADGHDLFTMTCGLGLLVSESLNSKSLPYHIDHFKAHAAIFLASRHSGQAWPELLERATGYLEGWGDEPPPPAVLIHAAHNLFINARELPDSDVVYDLVKAVRKEFSRDKTLNIGSAYAILNGSLGWRQSAGLIRLLWDVETRGHYRHTKESVHRHLKDKGYEAAVEYACQIKFVGDDGKPLVRAPSGMTVDDGATLLFPGGAGIGKTSIICKIAGSYLMIDYGRDPFGRTPHWRPEMDLLDAVLITHAHQDHIGGLLDLYGRQEYDGPWYTPAENEDLIRLSLLDSVRLEEAKFGENARYKEDDVHRIFTKFQPLAMGVSVKLTEKITATAFAAGHVAGSCQYLLESDSTSVFFSGDFNLAPSRSTLPIELPPEGVLARVNALVVEGTYAFREEEIIEGETAVAELLSLVRTQEHRPVLLPVLSLGRAQEVIAALSGTELRVGVFGLARRMTGALHFPLDGNVVLDSRRPEDVDKDDYDVLVASSGCLQGGPSKVFFERADLYEMPTILTGYLFPGTPARNLVGQLPRVRFSAHASHAHWQEYLGRFPNAACFLIHFPGDRNVTLPENVTIPELGRAYRVPPTAK